jgi:predicted alpha/beta superfamily hydrolase
MRTAIFKLAFLSLVFSFSLADISAQQRTHTLTGDIRYHKSFHSNILNNVRDVIVYVPPDYETNKRRRYPVLYLQDGQNLFDGATSFIPGQEWRIDETAQSLINAHKIEPLIIVGINNAGKDRVNEYTPAADEKYKGGNADSYGRMLIEELKPFIDRSYRTKTDPKNTGIGGSSLGGILSLYLGLKYKDVFGRVAAVSPSVWFANKQIVRYVEAGRYRSNLRIWLDIGTTESRDAAESERIVKDARLLKEALVKKGWQVNKNLRYFEDVGAEHNERAWANRVELILVFLFPAKND